MYPGSTNGRTSGQSSRSDALFGEHQQAVFGWTDRLLGGLLLVEWLAAVACSLWVSPRAWEGLSSYTHPHVWAATLLGGAVVSLPVALALLFPGGR